MTTITFEGKEYKLAHNLATELEFYSLTGEADIIGNLFDRTNPDAPVLRVDIASNLVKAMIKANNPGANPDDIFLSESHEAVQFVSIAVKEFLNWLHLPAHIGDHAEGVSGDASEQKNE